MNFQDVEKELRERASAQREACAQYANARRLYGDAKHNLFILLAPKQDNPEYRKASLDKQLILLLHDTLETHKPEVYGFYKEYIRLEQVYKGIEKVIEAHSSRISAIQSILKWEKTNVPI